MGAISSCIIKVFGPPYTSSMILNAANKITETEEGIDLQEILQTNRPNVEIVKLQFHEIVSLKDFRVVRQLGEGLHGQVHLVIKLTHVDRGTHYAMKVYDKRQKYATECAIKERIILEKISGLPFLANLCYAFEEQNKLYLVLKLAAAGNLTETLQYRNFTLPETRNILAELILAVDQLHSLNIIHRDLKPKNIVLDVDNHVQLIDFSLSTIIKDKPIRGICGTVPYMAPELLQTESTASGYYSKEIDWWSVGVLTIFLLSGKLPFEDACNKQTAKKITSSPPNIPETIKGDSLSFVTQLLVKDPAQRLGFAEGGKELLRHPFFNGTNWAEIENKIKSRIVVREGFEFKKPVLNKANHSIPGFKYVSPALLISMRNKNIYTKEETTMMFEVQHLTHLLTFLDE